MLEGTEPGLRALLHLLDDADRSGSPPLEAPAPVPDDVRDRWRERLGSHEPFTEIDAYALLADYGVPMVAYRSAISIDEVLAAAETVGYPVALKTAAPGVAHKSEVDGVRLHLTDPASLRTGYEEMAGALGPSVLVAAMAPPGVEVALGIVHDETFGPLVLVAAGGILVELLEDRRLGLPPLDAPRAARLDRRPADATGARRCARCARRRCRRRSSRRCRA